MNRPPTGTMPPGHAGRPGCSETGSNLLSPACSVGADAPFLQICVIPRKIPLISIPHIAGPADAVRFVWINDQLRIDAEASQRLIHLLTALHRNVEIPFSAEEHCRRL